MAETHLQFSLILNLSILLLPIKFLETMQNNVLSCLALYVFRP